MIGIDTLDRLLTAFVIAGALSVAAWFGVHHYGAERYKEGYAAAVAAGKAQHDRDAVEAAKTESDLRAKLAAQDATTQQKEIEHAQALADAQRRVRAGTDRLRCPASPVQRAAAPDDRPAAAGPATDGSGPDLVPEAAADVLGYGAAIAGLVSRYERVVERFEECRAVNAGP
jgi:hypothetical protein